MEENKEQTDVEVIRPSDLITKGLNFYQAVRKIVDGDKVTKMEWGDEGYYGVMDSGKLKLHKPDGQLYDWIISDGDIQGADYKVIS